MIWYIKSTALGCSYHSGAVVRRRHYEIYDRGVQSDRSREVQAD